MSIFSELLRRFRGGGDAGHPALLPNPDELVLLGLPDGEPEAQLWRDVLAAEGIRTLVKNTDAATAQFGIPGPAWAYEMWVLRKDLRRARAALGLAGEPGS